MAKADEDRLADIVREVKAELNPDGAGYHTSEACDLIVEKARKGAGFLNATIRHLARLGAGIALKTYDIPATASSYARAARAMALHQGDFAEAADDFGWLDQETALEEGIDAVRKQCRHLTYAEIVQVIELKRRKGAETLQVAAAMQRVVDDHPEWKRKPKLTLGDILGAA